MALPRSVSAAVLASLCLIACDIGTLPSPDPLPVIQGLLVVGEHAHGISVTWSVPADSTFDFNGPARPVAPQEVSLRLLLPGGSSVPVVPANPGTGQFEVRADILANTGYELTGTVAGRSVSAKVVTPGPFLISLPAGDTVRLSNADNAGRRVPYLWRANGAQSFSVKPFLAGLAPASDSTGTIQFFLTESDTAEVTFLAFERHAAEFFLSGLIQQHRGNITGALGALGAASAAQRVFIWQ